MHDTALTVPPTAAPPPLVKPWGPWLTFLFFVLILIVDMAAQSFLALILGVWTIIHDQSIDPASFVHDLFADGDFTIAATILSLFVTVPLCFALAWLRSVRPRDYFVMPAPRPKTSLIWCAYTLASIKCFELVSYVTGLEGDYSHVLETLSSASSMVLVWIGIVIAAPVSEEFLFRGFLYAGLAQSRIGNTGAVLITATIWALLHTQYDVLGMLFVFVMGLLLGIARCKTQSLWICVAMHCVINTVATIQGFAMLNEG